MNINEMELNGAFSIDPIIHSDERGRFFEGINRMRLESVAGYDFNTVQINHSQSGHHILRGLHYQKENVQAKLVWVTCGEIYDVIVDLRRSSSTFGRWASIILSADNKRRLLVPEGFAHGFLVLSENADITYLTSDIFNPAGERTLRWNCAELGIKWPTDNPVLNDRDANAPGFHECEKFA